MRSIATVKDVTEERTASDPSTGDLVSFKLAFPEDFVHHDNGIFDTTFYTPGFASQGDLQVGDGCLLDGFPCRITRALTRGPLLGGGIQDRFYGIGLFDQRVRVETFNSCYGFEALAPVIIDTPIQDVTEGHTSSSAVPVVSWVDGTHRSQDNEHFVLTMTCAVAPSDDADEHGQQQHRTTVWVIPKSKACYPFFLQERERFMIRERNKRRFLLFLMTIRRRQESPSAVLDDVEIPGVMQNIFDFVCEPRVFTLNEDCYIDED